MNRKPFLSAVLLMALLAFSGCTENKEKTMQDYGIELISSDFNFEKQELSLEVFSEKELLKTRIEVIGKEKLQCFDYVDLIKGKNSFQIKCRIGEKTLEVEITPSDGKTKEFEIEVEPKKLSFEKGLKYKFILDLFKTNKVLHYNLFVLDENKEFFKVIINFSLDDFNYYNLMLINKKSLKIYSSGTKNSCNQAFGSELTDKFDKNEFDFVMPVLFLYYQNLEGFNLNEFIKNREFSYTSKNKLIKFNIEEKRLFRLIEVYEGVHSVQGIKETPKFYLETNYPYLLLYYDGPFHSFSFSGKEKEEFNKEKYGCINENKNN